MAEGQGQNTGLLQTAIQGIWAIAKALQDSYLFGDASLTVGVGTVAGLPTSPTQGMRRMVTDANSTTFHAAVVGGGANVVPVYYDGSGWKIG